MNSKRFFMVYHLEHTYPVLHSKLMVLSIMLHYVPAILNFSEALERTVSNFYYFFSFFPKLISPSMSVWLIPQHLRHGSVVTWSPNLKSPFGHFLSLSSYFIFITYITNRNNFIYLFNYLFMSLTIDIALCFVFHHFP